MLARTLVVLAIAVLPAAGAGPDDRIKRIESGLRPGVQVSGEPIARWTVTERMAHHLVPSVSVAVVNNGRIEWAKAYGLADAASKRTVNTGTLFQAASISKPVSAIAALRLVARGQLSLDEDVNVKLKSWKVPEHSFGKPVTLRGLLSHTAGMTVHGFPGYKSDAPVPTLVQLLSGEKPANTQPIRVDVEPGSRWRYSGGGYTVMQLLIEDVTGKPFAAALKELVLDPLNMTRSTYEQPLPNGMASNAAHAHGGDGKGLALASRWHTYPEQAAAGLWTTPSDLARVLIAVQQADAGNTRLLPAAITREMLTVQQGNYGLGWSLPGAGDNLAFAHGGANAGFRCHAWGYVRKGQGVVVMTNGDRGAALASEIMRSVAAEYGWPDHQAEVKTPMTMPADQLSSYAGEYTSGDATLKVSQSGNGIRIETPMGPFRFLPESETKFFPVTDGAPSAVFEKDSTGKVIGFKAGNITAKKVQ